jgi:hypothetical protein
VAAFRLREGPLPPSPIPEMPEGYYSPGPTSTCAVSWRSTPRPTIPRPTSTTCPPLTGRSRSPRPRRSTTCTPTGARNRTGRFPVHPPLYAGGRSGARSLLRIGRHGTGSADGGKVPLFDCVEAQGQTTSGKPKKIRACPHCYERGHIEEISTRSEWFDPVPVLVSYLLSRKGAGHPARGPRRSPRLLR